ncbi:CAAX prenyl protease domain-containing protein [Vairimorpha necatrix]|uniref:CAAX prenyl protease domain-containing protein n=1 Tax=Vairimorpha necatrix TaxID=6039 RepID=A0AAX4J9X8_9MICR
MKNHYKAIFFFAFLITMLILIYEGLSLLIFSTDLKNGEYGIPKDSYTFKVAEATKIYHTSMMLAVSSRFKILKEKILLTLIYTALACCILLDLPRKYIYKFSRNTINCYTCTYLNVDHVQVAFTNIFVFLFSTLYLSEYIETYLGISRYNWINTILIYFMLYFLVCPCVVFCIFLLFRMFGGQLILALYISFIAKNLYEIFIEDDLSPTLRQLSAESFSEPVEKSLLDTKLGDKVFLDVDNSKETNAALVGLENQARIEIYGKFRDLPEKQQDSVLLHEIGHSIDHSLLKKLSVYFFIYGLELLTMLFLYNKGPKIFESEDLSKTTCFILLFIIYEISMKELIMAFYKLSSQRAETAADMWAKRAGFGEELSKSLLYISIQEASYIRPTYLYNAIYAMHPSIFSRVELLNKK